MKKSLLAALAFTGIFSFAQDWEGLESLPAGAISRHHPVTFSIGGIGYLVGGADATTRSLDDFYAYDPLADEWESKGAYPGPKRGFGYGVSSETKGYVGFGLDYNPTTGFETILADLWEYDPVTDEWTELASFPGTPRFHPAMCYIDGKIFVGLGGSAIGDLNDWWEYDIESNTWTARPNLPGPNRHHPYYFTIGSYVYAGFGHSGPNIWRTFYRYDPSLNEWEEMGVFPGQGRVAGTQFSMDRKGYILSGQGETHTNLPTGEFWEYTPETDSWVILDAHPGGGRWAPGSFVINGGVYFMCGEANSGVTKDLMRYQLIGTASTPVEKAIDIQLTPNPTKGIVSLNYTDETPIATTVFDASGRLVRDVTITNNTLDFSTVETGVYFVQAEKEGQTRIEKLIVE